MVKRLSYIFAIVLFTAGSLLAQGTEEMDPEAVKLWNSGVEKFKADDFQGAIADYEAALKISESSDLYYQKGLAHFKLDQFDEALTSFDKVLELSPDDEKALEKKALVFKTLGQKAMSSKEYDKAIPNLSSALEMEFDDQMAFMLGYAYFKTDDFENAVAQFDTVIALTPDNDKALLLRASCYQKLDKKGEAVTDLEKVLELTTDEADKSKYTKQIAAIYTSEGVNAYKAGKNQDAIDNFSKALEYEQSGAPYYYLGMAYKNLGNTSLAKQNFQTAVKYPKYKANAEYELEMMNR